MGKTTLLAFGLVVIATIQINAAPSPVAPTVVAAIHTPGFGNCVPTPADPKKPNSKHSLAEYQQAAIDLKAWVETDSKNGDGERGLEPNGNREQCLPILTRGVEDPDLTDGAPISKKIYLNSYIEGYVRFANAQLDNRGKGALKVPNTTGKGKGYTPAPFPYGQDDGAARVLLQILDDGSGKKGKIGPNWWYTIGHYRPGTWSKMQTFGQPPNI